MTRQSAAIIRTFRPTDLEQVHELFASGLMEFAGGAEDLVRRYVDHSLQDDLSDIPGQYLSHSRGNFWVADLNGSVVGIVGIQPRELEQEAELRRMSVSSSVRRQGIGRRLLETTDEFCRANGYSRIILSSVEILKPALEMYRRFGYETMKIEPYGEDPNNQIIVHHLVKELG
jgi:ribosomal protein S18 acetylase RimI-like enzyme